MTYKTFILYDLVEQRESHVLILLFLHWLLLSSSSSGTSSGGSSTSGSSTNHSTSSGSYIGDHVIKVLLLGESCEKYWPVALNLDSSSLDNGGDVISLHTSIIYML